MVAAAPAHTLVSLRGGLGTSGAGSPEQWQMNVRMLTTAPATDPGSSIGNTFRAACVTAAKNFITNPSMAFSPCVSLTELRFAQMGPAGTQIGATKIEAVTPAVVGVGSGPQHPYQCTFVLTLVAAGRGKGYKGRWYLPPMTATIATADGTISQAQATSYLTAAKSFVTAMNSAGIVLLSNGGNFGSVAIIGRSGAGGTARWVDELRWGRVMDTHRSRRRSLAESYSTVSVP